MEKEEKKLNTVHERDLDKLLEKIGLKGSFDNGKLFCKFCNTTVNKDNIYSFLPESGMINVVCNNHECIMHLLSYLEEKKKTKVG